MDTTGLRFEIGDGVYLRPVGEQDVDPVLNLVRANYDHLKTFMEWVKPDYSVDDAEEWIKRSTDGAVRSTMLNFGIFRSDELIGAIGFAYFDHDAKVAEIGYWIDHREEGKGIVSSAAGHLLQYAFGPLGLNRIQIRCASGNLRSAAIPERFGFKREGVQRQHVVRDGRLYDFWIFGLLKDEWLEMLDHTQG